MTTARKRIPYVAVIYVTGQSYADRKNMIDQITPLGDTGDGNWPFAEMYAKKHGDDKVLVGGPEAYGDHAKMVPIAEARRVA
jgi:hypothetical protein